MTNTKVNLRLPIFSIALTSAGALGYEILLMKLFSIIQWHHFAYMIISLALLGYGASGTFLALFQQRLLKHFPHAYISNLFLFGISSISCFLVAQQISFNPLEMFWDYKQMFWLFFIYLLLTLPFFFAANGIGLALMRYKTDISRLYRADMIGAGLGSLGILGLLYLFFPTSILQIVASIGVVAAAIGLKELNIGSKKVFLLFFTVSAFLLFLPNKAVELKLSQYKDLSQILRIKGAKTIDEFSSPFGTLTIVENNQIPFRYVPGLSLACLTPPPSQLAVFTNGDGMSVLTKYPNSLKKLSYLDYQTSALAYHLRKLNNVLIIGAGGGSDILQALYHNTKKIDAVELNPQMVEIVKNKYSDFTGNIYSLKNVNIYTAEAREFITSAKEKYDLIQMSMVDSSGASSSGLQSISENYLYTVQSLQNAIDTLSPNGYLSISRWLKLPAKDTLKLFAMALEALEQKGVKEPQKHLMLLRGWQTSTLIIKNSHFDKNEIKNLISFGDKRFFDRAYYYGMDISEANRFNILEQPFVYNSVKAILENKEEFYESYKFDIRPAYDNKPYFYHYFKWDTLSEIISLKDQGSLHLLEWGYLILIASFFQAVVASIVLILLPLFKYKKTLKKEEGAAKKDVLIYFFSLGVGFLFIEIYFIQKFILFLSHPIITIAVVLSSFLVFAGLGSGYSKSLSSKKGFKVTANYGVVGIFIFGGIYALTLDTIFTYLITQPEIVKIVFSIILIAPLAFAMGIPFPMGLSQIGKDSPQLIPWGWGVNGCASVISAIGAGLISIHFGFGAVIIIALAFYMIAFFFFPKKL
ncbi:MAG: methyltransferase domain-containing protein [Arcobacteraceae bacterium]|nr:methyltransferase domain-containing protein [Arcobacteraceae bacterium]